jgi:hypothetical protein
MIDHRDTALEIVEDDDNAETDNEHYDRNEMGEREGEGIHVGEQSVTQKYFNGGRGNVKLTRLNVEKKKKSPVMNMNKPMVLFNINISI